MQITDKFEIVPVAQIKPDEHNARKHSDEQVTELRRSLREFGFVNPLLIDKLKWELDRFDLAPQRLSGQWYGSNDKPGRRISISRIVSTTRLRSLPR